MQSVKLHHIFDHFSACNKKINIAKKREIDMNKIVDKKKKEVKANKNEMCSRRKLKCETSKQFWQSQVLPKGTFWHFENDALFPAESQKRRSIPLSCLENVSLA